MNWTTADGGLPAVAAVQTPSHPAADRAAPSATCPPSFGQTPLLDCADPIGGFQVTPGLRPARSASRRFQSGAAPSRSAALQSTRLLAPALALALTLAVALLQGSRLVAGSAPVPPAVVASAAPTAPGDPATAPRSQPGPRKVLLAPGRKVFELHCLVCHGRRGNGRGELARGMVPKPRDFTLGLFKFRSTSSGFLPTEDDLFRTIRGGLAGSAMPAFAALADAEIRAVIEHVKSLSPRWTNLSHHAPPVPLPPTPTWFSSPTERRLHADQGRPLFEILCASCHGPLGAGDGPSAATLADVRGDPCPPRDLRTAPFRRGLDPADLHRLLLTGLDGSPMPSFAEATTEPARWNLVAFVLSLRPLPASSLD